MCAHMTVAMDQIPHRLTWEAFIELPEELLRHAELHDGEVVEMASADRVFHVLLPSGEYHEWVDGDVVVSPLLPGFEAAIGDLISKAS
jgi:Uma2 family endonuclease